MTDAAPKKLPFGGRPGRPKGSLNKSTVKIAQAAREMAATIRERMGDITPLEVMLTAMRMEMDKGDWRMAASIAEKAAPYMHPRLAARVLDEDPAGQAPTIKITGGLPG